MKKYIPKEWLSILVLPLSTVVLGSMLAIADFMVKPSVVIVLIFTAIVLRIISVIRKNKVRFETEKNYQITFWSFLVAFVALVVLLVYLSYGKLFSLDAFVFLLLFYFFLKSALYPTQRAVYIDAVYTIALYGPIGVICAYMLCAHTVTGWHILLPAFAIGFFVAAAKDVVEPLYHTFLIVAGFISMIIFAACRVFDLYHFLFLLSLPLFIVHLIRYWRNQEREASTFLLLGILSFALLAGLGYLLFPVFGVSAIIL